MPAIGTQQSELARLRAENAALRAVRDELRNELEASIALFTYDARPRELSAECQRLREANRRLQAEGPALERDKLIAELRAELQRYALVLADYERVKQSQDGQCQHKCDGCGNAFDFESETLLCSSCEYNVRHM